MVERLINCGFSPDDAWFIVEEFLSEGDIDGLEMFVLSVETERFNVGILPA